MGRDYFVVVVEMPYFSILENKDIHTNKRTISHLCAKIVTQSKQIVARVWQRK